MLPWEQLSAPTPNSHPHQQPMSPGPGAPCSNCPAEKMRLPPSPPPHYPTLSSTLPATTSGLPPPSPKPHPLQAAPHPPLPPNLTCWWGPRGVQRTTAEHLPLWMAGQTLDNTQTIPWVFRAWQKELGYQGGAGAGLCPWWRPTGGVHVSEEKPVSRDIP